ncbi:SKIP/SNW domain containing protein, putative [Trypanosoma equiperdum]|uniref:SKIP/SNW domain containing protein, putative n=1 Tax=Trypanosoma equiperdum TaxID=5694 RepID=A0A1G4I7Q1_TRYEQ|nr:SKIP/SNW domain containing protein, putative [Trypanosoma equiperdum]
MYGISEDGGAFAECYFAQYPLGMGKTPPPPFVREAVLALRKHTDRSPPSSTDKSLALVPATAALSSHEATEGNVSGNSDKLAQTTERTREALELVLQERRKEEEERDFSGRNLKRGQRKKPALELTLSADVAAVGMHDPAPIVRSPTKVPKEPADFSGDRNGNTSSASTTVVPFSISNWKNKRKLIISLEQRIAQHAEARPVGGESISDNVMQLAVAMQQARKEVEAEQLAREKARMEEEERRQAEREAEATQRAKEILEKTASDALHSSGDRKKETREERLERIRLERELREREKQQELRQRRLAKAATRLGMSVEALEADEELLKNIDNPTTTRIGAGSDYICPPSGGGVSTGNKAAGAGQSEYGERPPTLHADELEEDTRPPGTCGIRKGVFGSAVISNEGIRREMEALAKLEEGGSEPKDGLRLVGDDDLSSGDDEDDGLGMDKLMKKKKKRRL